MGAAPADAALVNGGLMHSLEFDDTHTGSIIHGSSVVASAALAMAQAHNSTGAAMLGAYVRGWEALARMGLAAPGGFHAQGFQASSVAGRAGVWSPGSISGAVAHRIILSGVRVFLKLLVLRALGLRSLGTTCG
jgi:2-methylcitrate dehydratase PrpD